MAHRNGVDIQKAYDTAGKGATSDPVTRKLTTTLPGSGQKYSGNRADARRRLLTQCVSRIRRGMEWKDKLRSKRRPEDPGAQCND